MARWQTVCHGAIDICNDFKGLRHGMAKNGKGLAIAAIAFEINGLQGKWQMAWH
jgi:hypothetical protein